MNSVADTIGNINCAFKYFDYLPIEHSIKRDIKSVMFDSWGPGENLNLYGLIRGEIYER